MTWQDIKTAFEVAVEHGISTGRVWQIVKKHEMRQQRLKERGLA